MNASLFFVACMEAFTCINNIWEHLDPHVWLKYSLCFKFCMHPSSCLYLNAQHIPPCSCCGLHILKPCVLVFPNEKSLYENPFINYAKQAKRTQWWLCFSRMKCIENNFVNVQINDNLQCLGFVCYKSKEKALIINDFNHKP